MVVTQVDHDFVVNLGRACAILIEAGGRTVTVGRDRCLRDLSIETCC